MFSSFQIPTRDSFTQTEFEMSRVEYGLSSDFSGAQNMSVPASDTTFSTPNDLMKGTVYYFRISIRNSAGFGPVSVTMMGRTAVDRKYKHYLFNLYTTCGLQCITNT